MKDKFKQSISIEELNKLDGCAFIDLHPDLNCTRSTRNVVTGNESKEHVVIELAGSNELVTLSELNGE